MNDFTVNAIVLSVMPIGEYDRRLELLTKEAGRISVFARGARRVSSANCSAARVFAFGRVELFQGKNSYTLKSAQITNYFTEMADDIVRSYYGYYFLELCRYFSRENAEAGDMLLLLYLSLKALISESYDNVLVRSIFEIKLLKIEGIAPAAEKIMSGQGQFSFSAGMSLGTGYALNFVLESEISKLFSFKLDREVLREFKSVADHLMEYLVGKSFNSLELLETLTDLR